MRRILVTGASSDLGRIIVRRLAADAATEVIATMRRDNDPAVTWSPNVHVVDRCDLTDQATCDRLASEVDCRFPGRFGVVHSVGDFWKHVPVRDFPPNKAKQMFDSHVLTLYTLLSSLLPVLRAHGGGSVVAFSCNSARYNYPWMASFTASKSAVDSLIRSFANEFSGEGMRFNSLVLASVKTDKVRQSKPYGDYENFIPPDDIVPVIEFLLSDSAYLVNGNMINLFKHSDSYFHTGYFERVSW